MKKLDYNHYGHWINQDTPITGVVSNNSLDTQVLYDTCFYHGIDLDYQEFLKSKPSKEEKENYESYESTYLIGDWIKDKKDGLYRVKKSNRKSGFAAIVRMDVTQIVWSKFTKRCRLCSPCYPGQGDLDSIGNFLSYNLPDDFYYQD